MLVLKNITKDYIVGDTTVHALRGVDLEFRKQEFVAVLGQSGCGKTTLLNIIGGLDRFTAGDLVINGKSTKLFKERDWDTYRNHSIGFVFQSYNLIPHQTVLSNVELALTLSGVSKSERRRRAVEALERVGLGDQLNKKPNQMSGGQMQRVAIARALVNDPDILLADEPTGALDSETSVQIMEILKEISKDKLIIMVTHNPELADQYANRIIRLLDGSVIGDTNPYHAEEIAPAETGKKKGKMASMSFFTALSLSLNNLMTKKGRTFLTSFAGSIGIIGIALILALSSGARAFIGRVEEDTLSSYPLTIQGQTVDMTAIMSSMINEQKDLEKEEGNVYSNDIMEKMMAVLLAEMTSNDLAAFKEYIEDPDNGVTKLVNDIRYGYATPLNIFKSDTSDGVYQVNPGSVFEELGMGGMMGGGSESAAMSGMMSTNNVWTELIGNDALLAQQYKVLKGRMPQNYNEVVLIVNEDMEITDYTLYALGLKDIDSLKEMAQELMKDPDAEFDIKQSVYSFEELCQLTFKLVPQTAYFEETDGIWTDRSDDEEFMKQVVEDAEEIRVVGVLRPDGEAMSSSMTGMVGYTSALMEHVIGLVNDSEVVKAQKNSPDTDIFTGIPFETEETESEPLTMESLMGYLQTLPDAERQQAMGSIAAMQQMGKTEAEILATFQTLFEKQKTDATYDGNLALLGVADLDNPSLIYIYPKDFEAKETLSSIISDYNKEMTDAGKDEMVIQYTDYVGLMMTSVTTIIDAISYILIAFVAISLVVSSIMIGIITYISVLERTKEIGILRSIGASRKDISRVFNAETLIVGFAAGVIGIGVTLLLTIPINAIIFALADISNIAVLPVGGAVILVAISMGLTLIAGLIPAGVAARKDPVTALRTE